MDSYEVDLKECLSRLFADLRAKEEWLPGLEWGVITKGFQERMLVRSLKDKQVFLSNKRGRRTPGEGQHTQGNGSLRAQDSFRKLQRTLNVKPRS